MVHYSSSSGYSSDHGALDLACEACEDMSYRSWTAFPEALTLADRTEQFDRVFDNE